MATRKKKTPDELDGPLFRIRIGVVTQLFHRDSGLWRDIQVVPETHFTVVKRRNTIDLQTSQPVMDLRAIPYRTVLQLLRVLRGEKP